MRGRQYTDGTRAVFRVRYRAGYSPLQKITYNGTDYGITYVNDVDGLRRYIELVCTS
jgi:SPP1 family predicted phage head-tail adaptor